MKAKNKAKTETNESICPEAEKAAMEKALYEDRERRRLILDSLPAGVLIVDAETHTIVDINPAATKMIGAPREQIVGHTCHKFVCPKDVGECPIADLDQSIDSSERELLTATGEQLPVLKTVTTISLDGRKHLLESFIDLSERKRAETVLQDQARALRAEKTSYSLSSPNLDVVRG
jgi:PAS domain S-box-containing protein